MRRFERFARKLTGTGSGSGSIGSVVWRASVACTVLFTLGDALGDEPAALRYSAPITVDAPAPFMQMDLPSAVYAHAEQAGLRDLRLVDAHGERVPFALLAPRTSQRTNERMREVTLYPLPVRPSGEGVGMAPVDVVVDGNRISVRRKAGAPSGAVAPGQAVSGWLFDLGDTLSVPVRPDDTPPTSLRLRWSGPAEFSVGYRLDTSADMRSWLAAGAGQLMALQSPTGVLQQPLVTLSPRRARFVRLVWNDPRTAPVLAGAVALSPTYERVDLDAPTELTLAPDALGAPSGGASAGQPEKGTTDENDAKDGIDPRRALRFDLGAPLPLLDIGLRFDSGTQVAPVRLQGRVRADERWRDLGTGVFYRLERDGGISEAPAINVAATARYLRVITDARAAPLDPLHTRLVMHAALASLVFAQQGTPPWHLLAGSRDATDGALPLAVLVPQPDDERPRFGRASLGAFDVIEAAAREAAQAEQRAKLRPWLLWGVLLAGVGLLAALVWRLAKAGPVDGTSPSA